jgi:hypothetical protein
MSKEIVPASEAQDREMGAQLTTQFKRAINAMPEVLLFGAMMMKVEEMLEQRKSVHGGHISTSRGRNSAGEGIKGWLEKFAPEIPRATAYRLRDVTKSISLEFQLPASLAKKVTFTELVTSTDEELKAIDPRLLKTKAQLIDYVAGTSQKSWLDKFKPQKVGSYDRSEKGKGKTKPTSAQIEADLRERCIATAEALRHIFEDRAFYILTDAELDGLIDHTETVAAEAKAWRKKTKAEREEAARAHLAKLIS